MAFPSSHIEVAVIGAGAAGIGAARRLHDAGVDVLLIEARDRLGGRARTLDTRRGAIDLGCGWLHSADRNPWTAIAERLGFEVDRTAPPWQDSQHDLGMSCAERKSFSDAAAHFWAKLDAAAADDGREDVAANELLEPGERWNALIDAISTFINGAELDRVSLIDSRAYDDSLVNWRLASGYGRLIATYASGIPTALSTVVHSIDHRSRALTIVTDRGSLQAAHVIVTVPTNVLAEGGIRFDPELPDKRAAAAGLPLGNAEKVFFMVESAEGFPGNARFFGSSDRVGTGTYHMRPFGRPMIEAYFGGSLARDLARAGAAEMTGFALDEIVGVLGSSVRPRLTGVAASGWAVDPFARGSYSHALPGQAGARAALAEPLEGRLFLAGEACSPHGFSTAHGALESGRAAAEAVLRTRKVGEVGSYDALRH